MDHALLAQEHRPFDAVFQLPDVARPVVLHQHVDGRRRKPLDLLAVFLGVFFQEMIGQQQHVGLALPQRRHVDGKDVQAVVEIAPEGAVFDRVFQVLIGGGDDAHVGLDGLVAAHPLEFFLLEHPQQPHLDVQADGADLVQKKRAFVGQFEFAQLLLDGAGKRSFFVAEQLAFDEVLGQGRAVDLDEGAVGALAVVMDGIGHQLLPRSALPPDQDRGVAARDL